MKTHILSIIAALIVSTLSAETITLVAAKDSNLSSGTITLEIGDHAVFEYATLLTGSNPSGGDESHIFVHIPTKANFELLSNDIQNTLPTIAGPAIISLEALGQGGYAFATLKISRANEAIEIEPSNTVVIPSSSSGSVRILIESSNDLINWNAVDPGLFNPSDERRFFRIKAIQESQ